MALNPYFFFDLADDFFSWGVIGVKFWRLGLCTDWFSGFGRVGVISMVSEVRFCGVSSESRVFDYYTNACTAIFRRGLTAFGSRSGDKLFSNRRGGGLPWISRVSKAFLIVEEMQLWELLCFVCKALLGSDVTPLSLDSVIRWAIDPANALRCDLPNCIPCSASTVHEDGL